MNENRKTVSIPSDRESISKANNYDGATMIPASVSIPSDRESISKVYTPSIQQTSKTSSFHSLRPGKHIQSSSKKKVFTMKSLKRVSIPSDRESISKGDRIP